MTSVNQLLKDTKQKFKKPLNDFATPKNGIGIRYLEVGAVVGTTYMRELIHLQTLQTLTQYFADSVVSPRFLFKYASVANRLSGSELTYEDYLIQMDILQLELKRLLERSTAGNKEEKHETFRQLINNEGQEVALSAFLRQQAKEVRANAWVIDTDNFLSFIKIATKLSSEILKKNQDEVSVLTT
ncbi:MAG: hypothetical protein HC880_04605 [Bacteroidia bacterium]|nr:hypothetical protein [Bacteroidia bacterium]